MLAGLILALGSAIIYVTYSGTNLRAHPAGTSARKNLVYEPRQNLDSSGFDFVVQALPRRKPDSTLEELGRMWQGIGSRSAAEIDTALPNPNLPSDARFSLLITKAAFLNYEGEPNRAYEVLEEARSLLDKNDGLAQKSLSTLIFFQGGDRTAPW
jgi:hypothetical protein